jgi:phosphatidylglycerol:prolipoprotein diacylglycerol transferase
MEPIIFFGKEIYINPIALEIEPFKIYWYGIIIVTGIILALLLLKLRMDGGLKRKSNAQKSGLTDKKSKKIENINLITFDTVVDYLVGAIIIGFASARLYYVLFNLDYYLQDPIKIFMIWNGGIAIYGGVIGAILYGIYFCKKKKINFYDLADLLVPYLILVQSIGRWGNFVNSEAYGYETNLPWKMGMYKTAIHDYIYVHPTFLYESILTFLSFLFLVNLSKNKKFKGQIFYLYMILYGVIRFFIEGLRTDSLMLANFRISQVLSLVFVVIFGIIYYGKVKGRRNVEKAS